MARYKFTHTSKIIIILISFTMNTMQTPISPEICIEKDYFHKTHLNPCFQEPDTASCIKHIACKRHISVNAPLTLKQNAANATQDQQPFSVYDGRAVWIACLASKGLLRPGPDSDCAACGNACTQESRLEVCELFCTWSPSHEVNTSDTLKLNLKAKEKPKSDTTDNFIAESSSVLEIKFIVIAISCGLFVIIIGSLLIILLLKRYMMKPKHQQQEESKLAN